MPASKTIYLGVKGSVVAIDGATGRQLWATHLVGSSFVNVVLDGNNLLATAYGEIFCLDPANGNMRWHNPLKGFGMGLISMATETSPQNQQGLMARKRQEDDEAAAASSTATTT